MSKLKNIIIILLIGSLTQASFSNAAAPREFQSLGAITVSINGTYENETLGYALSSIGDFNGDGLDDFVIASPLFGITPTDNIGRVYLFYGTHDGPGQNRSPNDANIIIEGIDKYGAMGYSAHGAGDINNDGYSDLLVGAPFNHGTISVPGKAYLFFGGPNFSEHIIHANDADVTFHGGNVHDFFGLSVAGGGDFNGDNCDDILIGAYIDNVRGTNSGSTYIYFGHDGTWPKDINTSNANIRLNGEKYSWSGYSVSFAGDVNGDGLDDILIGAPGSYLGNEKHGRIYLVMGWDPKSPIGPVYDDVLEKMAVSSYYGELNSSAGWAVSGVGDVNGDDYDDFLIGAPGDQPSIFDKTGCQPGMAYLFFGKRNWTSGSSSLDMASNIQLNGETACDKAGISVSGAGDVNGDGLDDFIIGAYWNNQSGWHAGKAHLILGRMSGWAPVMSLVNSDMTYGAETDNDWVGWSVSSAGDTDGDGNDDILIGAPESNQSAKGGGKAYLASFKKGKPPTMVNSMTIFSDKNYSQAMTVGNMSDMTYIEVKGDIGLSTSKDLIEVKVSSNKTDLTGIWVACLETSANSGIYRGDMRIHVHSQQSHGWIGATPGEIITLVVKGHSTIQASILIWDIFLDFHYSPTIFEDDRFAGFVMTNFPYSSSHLNVYSLSPWIHWGFSNMTVFGTPSNDDVGIHFVVIQVYFDMGIFSIKKDRSYKIEVFDKAPKILTQGMTFVNHDSDYFVDYNSTEDSSNKVVWNSSTNASWLGNISKTGILNGTPNIKDVGTYWVNVSVADGWGGTDWTNFTLHVLNARPKIMSRPNPVAFANQSYRYPGLASDDDP
jgi:hypothetical protein